MKTNKESTNYKLLRAYMDEISGHIALFLSVDCFSTKEKIRIKIVFKMVSLEKIKIAEPHILKKKLQKKIPQPPPPPPPGK